MVARIGDFILAGELRNTRRNGVFGWIEFAPEHGIRIELTGNLLGALEGKHIRFAMPGRDKTPPAPHELPDLITDLADRQIGVTGEILLRKVKVPDIPVDDFLDLPASERPKHLVEKNSLHLEWFSQNGRIVADLVEPEIEIIDSKSDTPVNDNLDFEPLNEGGYGVGFTEIHIDDTGRPQTKSFYLEDGEPGDEAEDGEGDSEDPDDPDDPYGLFDNDIETEVNRSLSDGEESETEPTDANPPRSRNWEDFDLDPETRAMYEQMDEIFEGKNDQPISYLFETPLKLPRPNRVSSDEEAEPLVRSILAQLALLSVALDVCEHFTPLKCYQLLMNEILPTAQVHPNLAASEMVQHYSTSDFCEECEAEFDEEFDGNVEGEDEPI